MGKLKFMRVPVMRWMLNTIFATIIALLVGGYSFVARQAASNLRLQKDASEISTQVDILIRSMLVTAQQIRQGVDSTTFLRPRPDEFEKPWRANQDLTGIAAINTDGIIVNGIFRGYSGIGTDVSDRDYFRVPHENPSIDFYLGSPFVGRVNSEWTFPLSIPLSDEHSTHIGVLTLAVADVFFVRLKSILQDQSAQVVLRDLQNDRSFALLRDVHAEKAEVAVIENAQAIRLDIEKDEKPLMMGEFRGVALPVVSGRFQIIVLQERIPQLRASLVSAAERGVFAFLLTLIIGGLWSRVREEHRLAGHARQETARAEQLEERLRLATSSSGFGSWEIDLVSRSFRWDETLRALLGCPTAEAHQSLASWKRFVHADDIERVRAKFLAATPEKSDFDQEFRVPRSDGAECVVRSCGRVHFDESGKAVSALGLCFDVTKRVLREAELVRARDATARALQNAEQSHLEAQRAKEQLAFEARHDAVTGLLNRRAMNDALEEIRQADEASSLSYMLIDVDRFKSINDLYGHAAGDHLLRWVAMVLRGAIDDSAVIARIGGDEFAILLSDVSLRTVENLAERIIAKSHQPVRHRHREIRYSLSLGFSSGIAREYQQVQEEADVALYQAKRSGRNRFSKFTSLMRESIDERKMISMELLHALPKGEMFVEFQPQVDSFSKQLAGIEGLVRWNNPRLGVVAPSQFLPIADELGITAEIDAFVFHRSLEVVGHLGAAGHKIPKLSVNTSLPRLLDENLLRELDELGDLPCLVAFELLETVDFEEAKGKLMGRIEALRQRGVMIELDDVGSGRTSLALINLIRPDRLKIDRSLVNTMTQTRETHPMVDAITHVALSMSIGITAEGIETAAMAEDCADVGCDQLQGYFFARPMRSDLLGDWLIKTRANMSTMSCSA